MGVRWSSKIKPAAAMVTTSLKIPAMESVTTEVRFRSANSDAVMRKAMTPGKRMVAVPMRRPLSTTRALKPSIRVGMPSMGIARRKRVRNMIGARKKIDENGLEVAGLRRRRICVRPQRKPEKKAAEMTRTKPRAEKSTSPKTIIITPMVIVAIMATRRQEGVSRRKMKANMRTKAREEDLHIAGKVRLSTLSRNKFLKW